MHSDALDGATDVMNDNKERGIDVVCPGGAKAGETWLFPYPPAKEPKLLPPIVLAYMGDAVYEMAIRQYLISMPNHRPQVLHRQATRYVSAKSQARALARLVPLLTTEEADIVRQGRNAKSAVPKSANVNEYRQATALEALFGYLYFSGRSDRIRQLAEIVVQAPEEGEAQGQTDVPGKRD
ncbi:Mini-ribonuclease 3 [Paenibacillus popilliae]|uniref:Mini-ribonuclease 3 n=1 Tax=Paenibacillus popilliae ATCC 14706 TaxID=1212764 RepID=M9LY91_PAEPP|nr:ribonuclease III domain-containing protein [Paenibacillus popilliae]GAC41054.1 uncharacterized protein conserved in bacteria [Paenibacillus popilliae ATCC 14706]